MKILLYSDDLALTETAGLALRARNHELVIESQAQAAGELLDRGDLEGILYDATEPGPVCLSILRQSHHAPSILHRIGIVHPDDASRLLEVINEGGVDFCVPKPVSEAQVAEVLARMELRQAELQARQEWTQCLETRISSQINRADKAFEDLISALVMALDIRENESAFHSRRVALICLYFAIECGVDPDHFEDIYQGALLHDIGKIGIPDAILLKPGALTPEERQVMQAHVSIGVKLLSEIDRLKKSLDIPRFHHERFDGKGYLKGLSGTSIPQAARMFSIVDVYDALRSERPYKAPKDYATTIGILNEGAGTQFDPELLATFQRIPVTVLASLGESCATVRTFPQAMLACRKAGQTPTSSAREESMPFDVDAQPLAV
ncbi:MAG: HD domain-containing protein [Phycisphaerales bacterium]|nr:HD domain-containing protein [Phycisphaerales bacterium]